VGASKGPIDDENGHSVERTGDTTAMLTQCRQQRRLTAVGGR